VAWRAARVALALGVSFMAAAAIVLWSVPGAIVAIYLDVDAAANHDVVAIATRLMFIAALFQVFDGTQTVAAGALRGYKDTAIPMVIAGIGYWGNRLCGRLPACLSTRIWCDRIVVGPRARPGGGRDPARHAVVSPRPIGDAVRFATGALTNHRRANDCTRRLAGLAASMLLDDERGV
jgi:hypothetical protein